MRFGSCVDRDAVAAGLRAMRRDGRTPDASVVVPVNARGDLENVVHLLGDLSAYHGPHRVEVVLVVNNFAEGETPAEVEEFRGMGARVVAVASVRRPDRPGEAVCLSARIPGVRAAAAGSVVLLDADCRVPDATALLDWYVERFRRGAAAAYTHVAHYDYDGALAVRVKFAIHHAARWVKRVLLGIPTTRGSNYGVRRDAMLDLYDRGVLADDLNVGPAIRAAGGGVAFSSARRLRVFTSGRVFGRSWSRIVPYYLYRLRYNLRVLPVRADAARHTHRERKDPRDRYVYSRGGR